jgi:hypothetical protein
VPPKDPINFFYVALLLQHIMAIDGKQNKDTPFPSFLKR